MSESGRWAPSWAVRLLAESAVVVFSVVLALAVDGWRENRSIERQVQQTRAAFAEEIAGNQEMLKAEFGLRYHQAMWDHYRALYRAYREGSAQVDSLTTAIGSRFNTGVHPPALRDAVWRSLSQSDLIRHMAPREVFLLADVYREQEQLSLAFRHMLDIWLEPVPYRHERGYQQDDANVTRLFLADVVAAERRLLKRYQEGLDMLRS